MSQELRYDGRVAIVTGAGQGIGEAFALELGRRGARVLVNDLGVSMNGKNHSPIRTADLVVEKIRQAGGEALANYDSVEYGYKIVQDAIRAWGRVDIIINNAGILRDKSFHRMKEKDWDLVHKVHMKGSFMVSRAAWPYMRSQKYGKVINTASVAGIFGNFGQANYSAAKLGLHGFTNTLAKEGASKNIHVNTIAPMAATRMTKGVLSKELFNSVSVEHIVPMVLWLVHEECEETGGLFEVGGGWFAKLRWQRTKGVSFDFPISVENVRDRFQEVIDFENEAEFPEDGNGSILKMFENYDRNQQLASKKTASAGLQSAQIFEMMHNYLTRGEGEDAVKTCKATYNFEITQKKKGPVIKTWGIDLKNDKGSISLQPFGKPDATFRMTDQDFWKVCMREMNPQIAFLQGKMKIRGNMKAATLFTPELFPKPTPENMEAYRGAKL